jgi:carbon-monoxide dehydrogenase catalytic subunit
MDVLAKANGLEAVPPCLFMGSCVDNSRIEEVLNAVAGYLGVRIDQLPVAGSAPEYIAEKAIPIGFWTVSLGIFTHIGDQPNVAASERVVKWLTDDVEKIFGGKFYVEDDPYKSAEKIIEVIEDKRKALGI